MNKKVLLFLLTSQSHLINYIMKYTKCYYGKYVTNRDMRQEILLSYYTHDVSLPIDNLDPKVKNMFRDMHRYCRREKKYYWVGDLHKNVCTDVYQPTERCLTMPTGLSDTEKMILTKLMHGQPIYDILHDEKITFQRFRNIVASIKRKSDVVARMKESKKTPFFTSFIF